MLSRLWGAVRAAALLGTHSSAGRARGRAANRVVADRWHVGLVDLVGGAGLLGQVEGRAAASVSAWIDAQTRQWRAGVQVVAIDMCTVF